MLRNRECFLSECCYELNNRVNWVYFRINVLQIYLLSLFIRKNERMENVLQSAASRKTYGKSSSTNALPTICITNTAKTLQKKLGKWKLEDD